MRDWNHTQSHCYECRDRINYKDMESFQQKLKLTLEADQVHHGCRILNRKTSERRILNFGVEQNDGVVGIQFGHSLSQFVCSNRVKWRLRCDATQGL